MTQELEVAGKSLWDDLEGTFSRPEADEPEVFSPDFCDLREELKDPESEPLEEVVQHLRELGYLESLLDKKGKKIVLGPKDEKKLAEALAAYYADQDHFEVLFSYNPSRGESGKPRNVFRDEVLADQMKESLVVKFDTIARLRALTSLDGKVEFLSEPEIGEKSLRTRVLHHLLRIYGVLPDEFDAGAPYDEGSLRALRGLRALKGVKATDTTILEVMKGLNHFDLVAEKIAGQFEKASVWIPAPKPGKGWDDSLEDQTKAIQKKQLPTRVVQVGAFVKNDEAGWSPPSWNLFGIRFLQVYLWHRGHYFGEIDGLWGPISQEAFVSALKAHNKPTEPLKKWRDTNPDGSLKGYWMVWGDSYCLDVSAFIHACTDTSSPLKETDNAKSPDDIFEMQEAINAQVNELGKTDKEKGEAWSKVFMAAEGNEDSKQGRRRRNFSLGMVGRGIRRLLEVVKSIWANRTSMTLQEFVDFIVDKIRGAVRQALRLLKRILAPALDTAKLAARRVIRMITGAPYVHAASSSRWVLTKFSLDQDAVTLGSPTLLSEDMEAHFELIRDENRALDVVLRLGLKVLKIASTFTPPLAGFVAMTWVWQVLRAVWDLFRDLQAPFVNESAPWRTGMLMTT
ncbi:MAG: hypothetical protein B7Z37_12915 [Verrucomicrobia bacterium 12-59-8]|nr:MAG: hypothetical protein B7Z37_12915 [Verrucomicrobia bacterium 12-59-8]